MRIPPYYKQAGWQRFFAGVIIGMIIGWFFFIYEFGEVQEKLVTKIKMQEATIKNQKDTIEILRSDKDELNKENQKKLTVQEVKVYFKNDKAFRLSELSTHDLRSQIEKELSAVLNRNIESVAESKDLLYQSIENKVFEVNDKRYHVVVRDFVLYTKLQVFVEIRLAD
ncbi:hypothetical protein DS745_19640 [Anaerobacillus alkaliphilus]|uniref:Sporulation membrane protein YtrI C-terminal domain-containing protein n=2 Tax=Anaerobacillus alkaliphilus TaxID=1548597 RepID=A0A4Q0VQF6_9BACI|nr:hypothetical protein DS745_19640 [Anaerobacillus alkaliphilus]